MAHAALPMRHWPESCWQPGSAVKFCPSLWGGKDWPPEAYNPRTGLFYVPGIFSPTDEVIALEEVAHHGEVEEPDPHGAEAATAAGPEHGRGRPEQKRAGLAARLTAIIS